MSGTRSGRMADAPPPPPLPVPHATTNDTILIDTYLQQQQPRRSTLPSIKKCEKFPIINNECHSKAAPTTTNNAIINNLQINSQSHDNRLYETTTTTAICDELKNRQQRIESYCTIRKNINQTTVEIHPSTAVNITGMGNVPGAYMVDTEDSRKSSLQSDEEALMIHPIRTDDGGASDDDVEKSHLEHYCTLRSSHKPTTDNGEAIPAFCTLHRRKHRNKSSRKRKSTSHSIPDNRINDYLQELDAYLEEIDQESVNYSSSDESDYHQDDIAGIKHMFDDDEQLDCATNAGYPSTSSTSYDASIRPSHKVDLIKNDLPNIEAINHLKSTNKDDAVTKQQIIEETNKEDDHPLLLKQLNNYCTLRIPLKKRQKISNGKQETYFPTTNDIHNYFVEIKAKNSGNSNNNNRNKSETENQSNLCNNNNINIDNDMNQSNKSDEEEMIESKTTAHNDGGDCFKRDKQIRHTIIGGQTKKRETGVVQQMSDSRGRNPVSGIAENGNNETIDPAKRGRQLSWLRNSMRKTRPIDLPATIVDQSSHQPSTSRQHENRHINLVHQQTGPMRTHNHHRSHHESAIKQQHSRSIPRPRQRAPDIPVPAPPITDFHSFNQVNYSPQASSVDSGSLPHSQHRNRPSSHLPRSRSHSANQRHPNQMPAHNTPESHQEVPISINIGPELNEANIFNTLLNTTTAVTTTTTSTMSPVTNNNSNVSSPDQPRQMGRRSEVRPRVVTINAGNTPERPAQQTNNHRPNSAPARVTTPRHNSTTSSAGQRNQSFMSSEPSSAGSSRNPSPVSIVSSTASSSMASGVGNTTQRSRQRPRVTDLDDNTDETEDNASKSTWPHIVSRILATTSCTLGLFNISRFAIFSIHFGANFIVQFLILSFLFGCPFLWLQMCLAAKIKGGPVQMWRISPICKGVGIGLLIAQGVLTIYSSISVGWVLVYFRDSFVSQSNKYRWQEYFEMYRGPYVNNQSHKLSDSVADYFNGVVLQRLQLGPGGRAGAASMGAVRFQLAFNLGILWTFVFIVLCRGIRSYGKFVIVLGVLPFIGLIVVCSKFLSMINFDSVQNIFPATDWQDFFLNSRSWVSAAQETFLTWGLLGVSVYSMYCKSYYTRPPKTELRRDALIIVFLTIFGLLLGAILGSSCVQILNQRNYFYFPGSYENIKTYVFLLPADKPLPHYLQSIPAKWIDRYSMVMGESQKLFGANTAKESGYQVLRLVTELFPAALAAATREFIAPIWSLLGYLTFLFLGLAQLCAMWAPLAGALGDSPSSVLLSCITGLFLGIPLATESGIGIIHYLDTVLGGAWWILILWFAHLIGIFLIRGTPYTSDVLVNDLQMPQTFSAFIAFSWNVLLPIGLLMLSVIQYRVSNSREFFQWRPNNGYYWPQWTRQIAGGLQIGFLLIVPFIVIIQIYRYLSKGPPDILDRIQLLYRPSMNNESTQRHPPLRRLQHPLPERTNATIISLDQQIEDAPPKYTPPPSYTTATGARIAKMLRQSIRRSVRRIMGEGSRHMSIIQAQQTSSTSAPPPPIDIPPPHYSSIIMNETRAAPGERAPISTIPLSNSNEVTMGPRLLFNSETLGRRRSLSTDISNAGTLTPRDIAQFLRPSQQQPSSSNTSNSLSLMRSTLRTSLTRRHSRSVENLVLAAAPIGDSSIINLADHRNYEENVSVI